MTTRDTRGTRQHIGSAAGARLLGGLAPLFPRIQTVIADAGHESKKLARELLRDNGWKLQIVKRRERAFRITGLTWIVERTFAWLGRNRRLSKDYEYAVQTFGDDDRRCRHSVDAESAHSGMNFSNTLSACTTRSSLLSWPGYARIERL